MPTTHQSGATSPPTRPPSEFLRISAAAAVDAAGFAAAPAAALFRRGRSQEAGPTLSLLAVGAPADIDSHPAARQAERIDRPGAVLMPAFVNSHTHLDLTHIGPQPFDEAKGFRGWVDVIRQGRLSDPHGIEASVRRGVELLAAGGTAAVGDIAGAVGGRAGTLATAALARAAASVGMSGVSYVEFFAQGPSRARSLEMAIEAVGAAPDRGGVRVGLQPHAPYSVACDVYSAAARAAVEMGVPLCTHAAESIEEHEFVCHGRGPLREFLEGLGLWDDHCASTYGAGRTPLAHLRPTLGWLSGALRAAERGLPPPLLAHCNDVSEDDLAILAGCGASVAYCPRASAYFGAERHFGPHRYRDMLAAGVNVCLGTDSIVNLPAATASPETGGMSIVDEMRLLRRRDAADPRTLLAMATINGAAALGLEPSAFLFSSIAGVTRPTVGGRPFGGVVAVACGAGPDPLAAALDASTPVETLALGSI